MAEVKSQNPSINTHKLHHPPGPANISERKTRKKHLLITPVQLAPMKKKIHKILIPYIQKTHAFQQVLFLLFYFDDSDVLNSPSSSVVPSTESIPEPTLKKSTMSLIHLFESERVCIEGMAKINVMSR